MDLLYVQISALGFLDSFSLSLFTKYTLLRLHRQIIWISLLFLESYREKGKFSLNILKSEKLMVVARPRLENVDGGGPAPFTKCGLEEVVSGLKWMFWCYLQNYKTSTIWHTYLYVYHKHTHTHTNTHTYTEHRHTKQTPCMFLNINLCKLFISCMFSKFLYTSF